MVGTFSVSLLCRLIGKDEDWLFTSVYRSTDVSIKEQFWEELDSIRTCWNCPWLITGDFNAILRRSERSSGRITRIKRQFFSEFIDEHELLEFDRGGAEFTFSNGQEVPTLSLLDRFLSNVSWVELFGEHEEKTLGYYKLDHRMMILEDSKFCNKPRPFRF